METLQNITQWIRTPGSGTDSSKPQRNEAAEGQAATQETSAAAPSGRAQEAAKEADATEQKKMAEDVVSNLQDYVQRYERQLEFSVDEATGRSVIRVIDPETKETIREIPPEEVLELARYMHDQLAGEGEGLILRVEA